MYTSLHANFDRSFRGNQNFTRARGEVTVHEDDTTYIYTHMSRVGIKEFKNDYKSAASDKGGIVKFTGSYPHYYCEVLR